MADTTNSNAQFGRDVRNLTPAEQLEVRAIVDKISVDTSLVPRSLRRPAPAAARPAAPVVLLRAADSGRRANDELSAVELRWGMPTTDAAATWIVYRSEYERETRARVKGTTKTVCRASNSAETTWIDWVSPGQTFGYTVVCSVPGRGTSPPSLITLVDG